MSEITAAELHAVLEGVECGEVALTPIGLGPDEVYAGNVTYKASNGWTLVVFNDCDEWDYLDSAIAPDGRSAEYPSGLEAPEDRGDLYRLFVSYEPPADVQRCAYGFSQ